MKHIIAVLFEIEGPDYYKANRDVRAWVYEHREGHALDVWPEGTQDVRVVQQFEQDNDGQRVLYLPAENLDVEAGEVEVIIEDDKEEEDEAPYNGFPD